MESWRERERERRAREEATIPILDKITHSRLVLKSHGDNPVRNAGPSEVFFSSISSPFRFSRSETWGDNQVMKKIEKGTKMFSEPQNKNHEKGESKIVLG